MEDGQERYILRMDASQFGAAIKEAQAALDRLARSGSQAGLSVDKGARDGARGVEEISAASLKCASALKAVGAAVGIGFGLAQVKAFASEVISTRMEVEVLETSFKTLAGAQAGGALFAGIKEFAKSTPLMVGDLARAASGRRPPHAPRCLGSAALAAPPICRLSESRPRRDDGQEAKRAHRGGAEAGRALRLRAHPQRLHPRSSFARTRTGASTTS